MTAIAEHPMNQHIGPGAVGAAVGAAADLAGLLARQREAHLTSGPLSEE